MFGINIKYFKSFPQILLYNSLPAHNHNPIQSSCSCAQTQSPIAPKPNVYTCRYAYTSVEIERVLSNQHLCGVRGHASRPVGQWSEVRPVFSLAAD